MKVDLDLQDSYICDEIYRGKVLPEGFNNETMICVGYALGGKDTCQVILCIDQINLFT